MPLLPVIANLSGLQIGFICLLIFSLLLFMKVIKNMAIFEKLKFQKIQLPEFQYLYVQFKGPYGELGKIYDKVIQQTKGKFKSNGQVGLSYDDPKTVRGSECRSVVGISIFSSDKQRVNEFLKTHSDYTSRTLKTCDIIKTQIPWVNKYSFFLIPFKAIPGLKNYLQQNKISSKCKGIMQHYNMAEQKITISIPISNIDQFNLSVYPEPQKQKQQ